MLTDASDHTTHVDTEPTTSPPTLRSLTTGRTTLNKPTCSTPVLAPKLNRPVRMPKAVDAWNRLQRIAHIDIQPAEASLCKEPQYVVSVFMRESQSRIPTNFLRVTESSSLLVSPHGPPSFPLPSDATPDFQVLHSFSDYEVLRTSAWGSIRAYHPVYCELCDGMSVLMLTKLSQSQLLNLTVHRSPTSRAKKMRKFVLRVLTELHAKKAGCVPACKGQQELPILLHGFLFGEDTEDAAASTA